MGGLFSKAPPPPPSPVKLLDAPWRKHFNWGNKEDDLQYVNSYKPQTEGQQLRILLQGPIGAGKSSFINSVKSVLQNRPCTESPVQSTSHSSCTKKRSISGTPLAEVDSRTLLYKAFKIKKGDSNCCYPFVLNDMAGLNASSRKTRQLHVKDVKRALKGHIKEGYRFNPECKLSKDDRHYNSSPSDSDKVHILVFVIDASTISSMKQENMEVIEDIRDEANEMGKSTLNRIRIISVDEACPKISRDIRNVYKSVSLKKKIYKFSTDTRINIDNIYPVKNIHSESDLKDGADVLILHALRRIIERGDDFLNKP
uniref:G domain-containing protein n=1 Tax=Oreochromis niloticus TaxID=8128 RepID=I3KRB2_ORENI